ncbi:MAG: tetratricopeptide repeat protein [Fimbriimonas sp.]|nr:tetratricopeptide repeat protein [Fimbriimonas sp.]
MTECEAVGYGLEESPGRWVRLARRRESSHPTPSSTPLPSPVDPASKEPAVAEVRFDPDQMKVEWHRIYERAESYLSARRYHLAVRLLKHVVHRVPDHAEAWHKLGFAYGELGQWGESIDCFNKVLTLNPTWAEAWHDRGWSRLKSRRSAAAIQDFKRAVQLDPNFVFAWQSLGVALRSSGQFATAASAFRRACSLDVQNEFAWREWATCSSLAGDRDSAIHGWMKVCALSPMNVSARLALLRHRQLGGHLRQSIDSSHTPKLVRPEPRAFNLGKILPREHRLTDMRSQARQARLQRTWEAVQNPVAWIMVLFLAALLYVLLGK